MSLCPKCEKHIIAPFSFGKFYVCPHCRTILGIKED